MTYYTIQLHLSVKFKEKNIVELNNIEEATLKDVWPMIYQRGVKLQHSPGTWEVISPLHINTFFIIKQQDKV